MAWWEKLILLGVLYYGFRSIVDAIKNGVHEIKECIDESSQGTHCNNCGGRHHYSAWQCEREEEELEMKSKADDLIPDHYWDGGNEKE